MHRGPTHSIFLAVILFIPIFLVYRKHAIPYFLALISHSLIGDFFIGGQLQLFWPFSSDTYGFQQIGPYNTNIYSTINIVLEMTLFVAAIITLYKTRDWKIFFRSNKTNLVLVIPIITVLLPSTIGYPFTTPLIISQPTLAMAHIFYLVLFSIAVTKTLSTLCHSKFKQKMPNKHQNSS
ncbi:MAG: metal-dependent hydrolase [Betaproteobacteria bacterium]